jgi:HK97 family phage portal protein
MEVSRPNEVSEVRYLYHPNDGSPVVIPNENMLHNKPLSKNGITGLSAIGAARENIALGKSTVEYGGAFFGNAGVPSGVLSPAVPLKAAEMTTLQETWKANHQGKGKWHKTAVVSAPMTYNQLTMNADDMQFIETSRLTSEQIAALFGVPQHKAGILDHATFSNINAQDTSAIQDAIRPRLKQFEAILNEKLFFPEERERFSVHFNIDDLLRGDIKTRFEAYQRGIQHGFLNRNEVRQIEGLNSADGLSTFLVPVNMQSSDQVETNTEMAEANLEILEETEPEDVTDVSVDIEQEDTDNGNENESE